MKWIRLMSDQYLYFFLIVVSVLLALKSLIFDANWVKFISCLVYATLLAAIHEFLPAWPFALAAIISVCSAISMRMGLGKMEIIIERLNLSRITGQATELQVGQSTAEFSRHFEAGCELVKSELYIDESRTVIERPGLFAIINIWRAIHHFEVALRMNSSSWQTCWMLGKIYQRMGNMRKALYYFSYANLLCPSQADVVREASITAGFVGDGPTAVHFSLLAIQADSTDSGLLSNLAIAHLINGDNANARIAAIEACSRDPKDAIAQRVKKIIEEVINGARAAPKSALNL